ncbi:MAG: type topoisomerase, partial [Cohnella sp.]|nr:type topoisomerase [Cohnella sp.]
VHTVMTEAVGERFKTTIKELLSAGWKVVYADQADGGSGNGKSGGKKGGNEDGDSAKEREEEAEETETPFVLDASLPVMCKDAEVKSKETQPPKHYNEGTLLKAMESAGKQIEDEELRDAMKDSGLGTPATRAATIERLKQVGYIDLQGKKLMISRKGRTAIELIRGAGVDLLASPEMTGQWERRLTEISRGQASAETFMGNVKKFAVQIVERVRGQQQAAKTAFTRDEAPSGKDKARSSRKRGGEATGERAAAASTLKPVRPASTATTATPGPAGTVTRCPRPGCGGHIFMGRKGYGCSEYRSGCSFVIWKNSFGRDLTDAMIRSLVEKGKTGKLKLKDDEGAPLEGRLVLTNPATGELVLERM